MKEVTSLTVRQLLRQRSNRLRRSDRLRTVLKIESSDTNPIKGNFWSIDQTYLVFPSTLTIQGGIIKMSIPGIGASWQGKLSADGDTLTGTLKGFSIPVQWTMKRITPDQAWVMGRTGTGGLGMTHATISVVGRPHSD